MPMKKIILTIIYVLTNAIYAEVYAIDWPVNPTTSQHGIVGTIGEARGTVANRRFHKGTDVIDDQMGVYAMRAGITASGGTTWGSGYVLVDGIYYWHTSPDLPNGTTVVVGQRIATMRTGGAIHVHIQEAGVNHLHSFLGPFVDNTYPVIVERFIKREGYNYTTTQPDLDVDDLWGKIDIVIRSSDTRLNTTGGSDGPVVSPYIVRYELLSSDGSATIDDVDYITFGSPPDNTAAFHIFGIGATSSNPIHVVTNHPYTKPFNRYWNSFGRNGAVENWSGTANLDARESQEAKYKDARYIVRFIVADTDLSPPGNVTQEDQFVFLNNFKPYVKKVEIGSSQQYVGEWTFNQTNGQLILVKSKDNFIAPGSHAISIEFSEPVRDTPAVSISTFSAPITLTSSEAQFERKIWTGAFTIGVGDNSHDGIQTLTINANDISGTVGEPLDGDPSSVALRDASGVFQDANNGGYVDRLHKIKIDTMPPVTNVNITQF